MNISDNTVFITGGASGLGFELARLFLDRGNDVIVCDRNDEKLANAKVALPQLHTLHCDISVPEQVREVVARLRFEFPRLNLLVNNAAVFGVYDFEEQKDAAQLAAREIAVNLTAPISLSKALFPLLKAQERSALLFISSALAYVPFAGAPSYCATKAGLHSFCISLRHQLKESNVSVFEALPPLMDTELVADVEAPKVSAQSVARRVLKALSRDQYEIRPGTAAIGYWGLRIAPGLVFRIQNLSRPKTAA